MEEPGYETNDKVLPEKLEAKQITQTYLEDSVALLNNKDIPIEDKKWELKTRKSLVKSMVHITAIEASYNVARVTVIAAFFMVVLHLTARIMTRRKES